MLNEESYVVRKDHPRHCRNTQQSGRPERPATGPPARHHDARDRHSFRKLVQKDGDEHNEAELGTNQKRACDCHSVEERMQQEADQRGCAGDGTNRVCFLAKVKVGRERVLCEMHRQVSGEH